MTPKSRPSTLLHAPTCATPRPWLPQCTTPADFKEYPSSYVFIIDMPENANTDAISANHPNCLGAAITKEQDTALTFAAAAKRTRFVKKLLKLMTVEELELKTNNCTALYFAAQTEIVTIAEELVKRHKDLPSIFPENCIQLLPLYAAIRTGNRDMVSYLYSVTPVKDLAYMDRFELFNAAISNDLFGFRGRFCNKAMMKASAHQLVYRLWKVVVDGDNFSSTLVDGHHIELLVEAAKVGNVEFLLILIRSCHDLIRLRDQKHGTLFHIAIKHRQERVFNLIYEIGVAKVNLATYHAEGANNMLHLAGQLPSSDRLNIVSGAALQMQRELLWFQEIEKIVRKSFVNERNENGETPKDIFVNTHEELRKNGEKWMRNTANSCMLMAALIVTVVFPAAFTIPLATIKKQAFLYF
ncbi:uncharacterized protein LOC108985121 [Juglans regia]|uniref:Uncharacterized protein LOC108985121 n=1 Tax=Juglans regia TaxID=51240 RepID=A0A6P9EGI7_JUGRE|nr:uncharacterized protein LOC108985121 [Juglans regia]